MWDEVGRRHSVHRSAPNGIPTILFRTNGQKTVRRSRFHSCRSLRRLLCTKVANIVQPPAGAKPIGRDETGLEWKRS
jgi:hypothetical protein